MDLFDDDSTGLGRKKKEDLYEAYKRVIEKHGTSARHMSRSSLYEEAANSPAPRFYVTPYRAGIIINEMVKEEKNAAKHRANPAGECPEVSGALQSV